MRTAPHLVQLPGTEWAVWRNAVIRSTGFPVDGLDRFSAGATAAVADAYLAGTATAEEFDRAFTAALRAGTADARDIARDPLFREAVIWQNRTALHSVDAVAAGLDPARRNCRNRDREVAVLRYWQRYCTKNETVGFFGPIVRVRVDPAVADIDARPGPALTRHRQVILEHWALQAYADVLASDAAVRRWLPPELQPHYAVRGGQVLRPNQPPLALSASELAVVSRCDGRRAATSIAAEVVADATLPQRKEDDVLVLLDRLVERGLLRWDGSLPINDSTERVLREMLTGIGDPRARERAMHGLDRLSAGRDEVAAAAGDPDRLLAALNRLDAVFEEITGRQAQRNPGQMYASRTLCVEDTARDIDITVGAAVLDALAGPLTTLLHASRWVTAEVARIYLDALGNLFDDLAGDRSGASVPLSELWFLAQGLIFGSADKPSDRVTEQLTDGWAALFGLDRADLPDKEVRLTSAELADRLPEAFAADRPGWRSARIHSPDLAICAGSLAELRRGDFFVVLGEMHAGYPAMDSGAMLDAGGPYDEFTEAFAADTAPGRILPLYPHTWPRFGRRTSPRLHGPHDRQLGTDTAPGADPDRLLPLSLVDVIREDGALIAVGPDGGRWPLIEMFAGLIAVYTLDAFKLVAPAAHTPRLTLDRLVVARETWRTTVGEVGLAPISGEREIYLAVRRWCARLGLPDRVFIKLGNEVKPFYVDLTSPQHLNSLRRFLRAAREDSGDDTPVVITELLPGPEHAWLPDAQGRRYFSELRLHAIDPRPAAGAS